MKNIKLFKAIIVVIILAILLTSCQESSNGALYTPGSYTGNASGYGGPISVSVEVDDNKITKVEVVEENETEGIGTKAIETLPDIIVNEQSTDVDIVSGATISSNGIITAAENALNLASGQQKEISFEPGTYIAKEYGNNGYLSVEVEMGDSEITSISVKESSETKHIGDEAIKLISDDIINHQTLNVDSIAGATITSNALKTAVTECIEQAGADPSALQTPVPSKGSKNSELPVIDADVIIVGAGGAGLSAAVTAKEEGAEKVIIIEKMPIIGGNTLRSASAYNTSDPKRQSPLPMTETLKDAVENAILEKPVNDEHKQLIADVEKVYEEYLASGSESLFDCPEWHALQTYNGGDKVGDVALIRQYAENTLLTLEWMEDLGMPLMDEVSQGAGALWQRTHQTDAPAGLGIIDTLYSRIEKSDVEIIKNMKAEELIMSGDTVTGVMATDIFGSEHQFNASKGVILTTGGYANNEELRVESNPALTSDMVSTNHPGATGDGIIMAQEIGAGTTGMDYVQVYPLATPGTGALQGRARTMSGLDNVIVVNKEGRRFVNEDARRDDFVAAIQKQTDGIVYDINDATIVGEYNSFDENVETLVELGRIYKGDTLEELEKQLDIPTGNLQKTVSEYNEMVAVEKDPEFGRKLFADKIETGPFYATPRAPSIHHTMGGIMIDIDARVLDTKSQVINGLYAAGEVVGGIHGSNRLGGNATADVTTFGRIAAKSLMNK